jgi:4-hydroxybenzoyl-CoA reductase subunit beta
MLIAGGTDLLPNMKRRHQAPQVLVSLGKSRAEEPERHVRRRPDAERRSSAAKRPRRAAPGRVAGRDAAPAQHGHARRQPLPRHALQLLQPDLRVAQGDRLLPEEGRQDLLGGDASKRCVAVSSTDTAPALIALNASVLLKSSSNEREVKVEDLYRNDGIEYLSRRPEEILTEVNVPAGWTSTYWKLRRRGSFDFPILGVAAAVKLENEIITEARIALGAVASAALPRREGRRLP